MVNRSLDLTFAALADPTRRAILRRLMNGRRTVSHLAQPFDISLPAVSKHLRVLEQAGLIRKRRRGREHLVELVARPLKSASSWLDAYCRFWDAQLDSLEQFLDRAQLKEKNDDHQDRD